MAPKTPTPAVAPKVADPKVQPDVTAPVDSGQQFSIVKNFLAGDEVTKATRGGDGAVLRLRPHEYFKKESLSRLIDQTNRPETLLGAEKDLMVQIERLEAVERAISAAGTAAELQSALERMEADAKAMFDHLMFEAKSKDREIETQVRSFQAFLLEAGTSLRAEAAEKVYVLNVTPEHLQENPQFGQAEKFGPIDGLGMVHTSVFGLWILGLNVRHADQAAGIGVKAEAHTALAVMNIDTDVFPEEKRRDPRGAAARRKSREAATGGEAVAAAAMRTPISRAELKMLDDCFLPKEGMEKVALCLSPVRVRAQSQYEDGLGDVFILPSYVVGGKLVNLGMVSKTQSTASSPFQLDTQYQIGSYAVEGAKADYGPFLYDFEGISVQDMPVIAGAYKTGVGSAREMARSIPYFSGQYVAKGRTTDCLIPSILSHEYLRRIMIVLSRGMEGKPQEHREVIRRRTEAFLLKNLVGNEASKPFSSIEVIDDKTSAEGKEIQAQGGIRLIVKVTGKTVIPEVRVAIMPSSPAELD